MTPPERVLWSHLRRRQLGGYRFRRQHALGPFVADFYCVEARLIVEVDSRHHTGDAHDRDACRDAWLIDHGCEVVRVTAGEIATDIDAVLRTILRTLQQNTEGPHPGPPPSGRGRETDPILPRPDGGGVAEGDGGGDPKPPSPTV